MIASTKYEPCIIKIKTMASDMQETIIGVGPAIGYTVNPDSRLLIVAIDESKCRCFNLDKIFSFEVQLI